MFDLKKKFLALAALAIACLLPIGVYAQKGDKRPPKDEPRVVVQPKGERPPPSNNNQGDKPKGDKRGKP